MRITYGLISADLLFFSWSVNVSMKKKTDRLCLLLMLLILCCCAGARGEETMNCYTDKSMYAPGETICLRAVEMPPQTQWLRLTVFHLEQTVLTQTLPAQEEISLSLPEQDGAGYLVRVQALDARQNVLACADMAVDVSSSWTKFPAMAMCGILRRLPMRRARSLRWRAIISTACSFTIGSIAIISRWPMICPPGRIGRAG